MRSTPAAQKPVHVTRCVPRGPWREGILHARPALLTPALPARLCPPGSAHSGLPLWPVLSQLESHPTPLSP